MEQTDKQLELIDKVINMLCVVYDDNEFNFDKTLLISFKTCFQTLEEIDINRITPDYNQLSLSYTGGVKSQLDKKFLSLISWKPKYIDLTEFRQELENDFNRFIHKQNKLNVNYAVADRIMIKEYYFDISLRNCQYIIYS